MVFFKRRKSTPFNKMQRFRRSFNDLLAHTKTLQMWSMLSANLKSQVLKTLCVEFTSIAHLAFPLQLRSEPLKVAVPPPYTRLLQLEDGQVGLWTNTNMGDKLTQVLLPNCCFDLLGNCPQSLAVVRQLEERKEVKINQS